MNTPLAQKSKRLLVNHTKGTKLANKLNVNTLLAVEGDFTTWRTNNSIPSWLPHNIYIM
jgi:hypothetical protein